MPLTILVCGGGNGAHTLAATAATHSDIEVHVMTLFADEAERWSNTLGADSIFVDATNNGGSKLYGKPKLITKDPQAAMEGVDAIFFVVPAFAHQQYFDAISQYLKPNTTIVGMPGQAGFEFQALASLKENAANCAIISLESLPWACRILKFAREVQILGYKDVLGASLIPGKGNYKMPPLQIAQSVLGAKPKLAQTNNYLAVNLMAKSIIHPPVLYGKWKDWDGKPVQEAPLFYQGVDDLQAGLLSKVSDEVLLVAKKINELRKDLDMKDVIHIFDWYKIYYADQVKDTTNLKTAMQTNSAYDGLLHPMKKVDGGLVPDFSYRYIAEDVPFGLVVIKGMADCVGVPTPTMDTIILWAQEKMGKEYIVGSTLTGKDVTATRAPQAYGFKTLEDLCKTL